MINPFHKHNLVYQASHKEFKMWTLWMCKVCCNFFVYDKLSDHYNRIKVISWDEWEQDECNQK